MSEPRQRTAQESEPILPRTSATRLRMLCPTCQVPEVWRETAYIGRCSNGHAIDLSTGEPIVPADGSER